MRDYKRLTERRGGLVIDKCGNCPNVNNPQGCTDKKCYEIMKNRLADLEDKIESGQLVELPFAVFDKQAKKEADGYKIALEEDWAKFLCYCDIESFAITQDGNIILLDECNKYVYCPCDRFEIITEARLKEFQEKLK